MTQPFDLTIEAASQKVVLHAALLASGSSWPIVREFVGRMLSSPVVKSVELDRRLAKATIHLCQPQPDPHLPTSASTVLRQVAATLRQPSLSQYVLNDVYAACVSLNFQKTSAGVTAGQITSLIAGRVRIRHPLLQRNVELVRRVETALAGLPGVEQVSASAFTGSVLILFRQGSLTGQKLLAAVECLVVASDDSMASLASPPFSHWIAAGTCLSLATATVVQPALAPVTAAALVCCNVQTLSRGLVELCTLRWKVSSLYTVIMGTTLISGQFLVAAIMQASITGWHAWTNHRLRRLVHELTALPGAIPEFVPAESGDEPITLSAPIVPGSVITIPQGSAVACDGIVVDGEGDLDEQGVRGIPSIAHCKTGDSVFAGSVLMQGDLQVKVVAVDSKTRRSAIRGTIHTLLCDTVGTGGATPRAKAVASRFVPFTFATGTAAFLVGDLVTLAAVLRPDYCTGASLTDRFGTLSSISHLLHEGWLVRNRQSLDALSRVTTIVVANTSSASGNTPSLRIGKFDEASHIELHELTGNLADCTEHVKELRRVNSHVAVVGDQNLLRQLAELDVVRISMTPERCLGQPYADLIALHAQPQRLGDLLRVLRETRQPERTAWAAILTCNALAISGAFLIGLTSLHAVVLTNAGVLAAGLAYERHVRRSRQLLTTHRLNLPREDDRVPRPVSRPDLEDPALAPVVPRHGPLRSPRNSGAKRVVPRVTIDT